MFNQIDDLMGSCICFAGDSLLSPQVDDDIPTLPTHPSPAPETSNNAPDNATSKASLAESAPYCGSLASLAGPGLALGSGRLTPYQVYLHAIGLILFLLSPNWAPRLVLDSWDPTTWLWVPYLHYLDDDNRLRDQAGLQELDSIGARPLRLHRHQ